MRTRHFVTVQICDVIARSLVVKHRVVRKSHEWVAGCGGRGASCPFRKLPPVSTADNRLATSSPNPHHFWLFNSLNNTSTSFSIHLTTSNLAETRSKVQSWPAMPNMIIRRLEVQTFVFHSKYLARALTLLYKPLYI